MDPNQQGHAGDGDIHDNNGLAPVARASVQNTRASSLLDDISHAKSTGDLEDIVNTVVSNQHNGVRLMEVASVPRGERALQKLVGLVAQQLRPEVLRRLFRCLIEGWIMEQSNGPDLLRHFFTTLDEAHCSAIFIREVAIPRFWNMITSRIGCMSIMLCLRSACYTAQTAALQNIIVFFTVQIAKNEFGSSFLRGVLQMGGYDYYHQLKERIRERVEVQAHLVELSMDPHGNDVVRACFVPNPRLPWVPLLERGLHAFSQLWPGELLRDLVRNLWAGRVLTHLLCTSVERNVAQREARSLAERILGAVDARNETGASLRPPAGDDLPHQAIALIGRSNLLR